MVQILNPIYDSSFKFLMEDERVARTVLSALLKRKVLRLEQQAQERAADLRDRGTGKALGLYRLDYVATVETLGGGEETVSIELQKAWMETEMARFRRYIGVRYSDPDNVDRASGAPRHIVTIYILGHNICETSEAIAYGYGGRLLDYDGNPAAPGDGQTGRGGGKFVSSITHDTIIVQVRRLPERPRNVAERLMSVFDQRAKSRHDRHVLNYDSERGGTEASPLVRRLSSALVDDELLGRMELEEEMQTELELKNAAIDKMERQLAEAGSQLRQKDQQLEQSELHLRQQEQQLEHNKEELNAMRRITARTLHAAGQTASQIADTLGISIGEVEALLGV